MLFRWLLPCFVRPIHIGLVYLFPPARVEECARQPCKFYFLSDIPKLHTLCLLKNSQNLSFTCVERYHLLLFSLQSKGVEEDKDHMLEKFQNGKTAHEYISQTRSTVSNFAAHLTGKVVDKDRMNWEDKQGLAFRKGMDYKDGSLYIPQDGVYYVYSQVYFIYNGCKNGYIDLNKHIKTVTHSVNYSLEDEFQPEKLLESRHSACQVPANTDGDSGYWSQTSYQGGLFKLKKGYRLNVIVSMMDLVDFDENKTFFGAFFVSE
uniref:THD domain-containing protein n=1 Tax=Eptatretus burgeri TaxID=7764 RepID=A0A8C4Q404_EPTBU